MGLSRKPADPQKLSIINFCDKNAVNARFRDKYYVFDFYDKMSKYAMIYDDMSSYVICMTKM